MRIANDYSKRSLNEVVVLYIKNKILTGEYKSGDKLLESEISVELNVSRAPVREAMRELNMQGIIKFSPRIGNRIVELTIEEVIEIFDIRIALENQILEKIVTYNMLTSKDFEFLEKNSKEMLKNEKNKLNINEKLYRLNNLDIEFHNYLWLASNSKRRPQILEGLFYQLLITMNRNVLTLGTFEEKAVEHMRIIDALKNNDLDKLLFEFKNHIGSYISATISQIGDS